MVLAVGVNLLGFALPRDAAAVTYNITQTPMAAVSAGVDASGMFDLTTATPAFVPGLFTIDSALVSFTILEFGAAGDTANISLAGSLVAGGQPVNMGFTAFNTISGTAIASLEQSGKLAWLVQLNSGNGFTVLGVALNATASEKENQNENHVAVPESGATVAPLGMALLGLHAARRVFRRGTA